MTNPTYDIGGKQQNNISDAINALNQGWNVTTSGNASGTSVQAVQPGSTVTFDGGKNIVLTQHGSLISIATSDTPLFTSIGIVGGGPTLSATGLNMAGQKITNVAAGDVSADSTDAVNGSQLYQVANGLSVIQNGGGVKYFHANGGNAADSQANGAGSVAAGPAAVANGANAVAIGNGAQATKDGDVAMGSGSVADRGAESYKGKYSGAQNDTAGTVSVGSAGHERTLSNVADGEQATDAVNVRQLDGAVQQAKDYTNQQIATVNDTVVNVGNDVKQLQGDVTNLQNGSSGMFQTSQGGGAAPQASGKNSVALGAVPWRIGPARCPSARRASNDRSRT